MSGIGFGKEPKFNVVYSTNNLSKIKDGVYVIKLDGHKSIGTHWKPLYVNGENGTLEFKIFQKKLSQQKHHNK